MILNCDRLVNPTGMVEENWNIQCNRGRQGRPLLLPMPWDAATFTHERVAKPLAPVPPPKGKHQLSQTRCTKRISQQKSCTFLTFSSHTIHKSGCSCCYHCLYDPSAIDTCGHHSWHWGCMSIAFDQYNRKSRLTFKIHHGGRRWNHLRRCKGNLRVIQRCLWIFLGSLHDPASHQKMIVFKMMKNNRF